LERQSTLEDLEMKILIIGNMGYVGPVLMEYLSKKKIKYDGLDVNFFNNKKVNNLLKKKKIHQTLIDVRDIDNYQIKKYNAVVYLAAISNDPMGNEFQKTTFDINWKMAMKIAKMSKKVGVKKFIFASSCSMYGISKNKFKTEKSKLKPLTSYAKSKVKSEKDLKKLSSKNFKVISLRFATACGYSKNLRLDLVLNDFVTSAILTKNITILSDGSPWRPLIHVKDMSRAIHWGIKLKMIKNNFLALNVGNTKMNYVIEDIAKKVTKMVKGCKYTINRNAPADKRSYSVDFTKYEKLSKHKKPLMNLNDSIKDLIKGIKKEKIPNNFRNSTYMRLNFIRNLIQQKKIDKNLYFI
jgi:nucleoside-diphosphate-sugar epimerase